MFPNILRANGVTDLSKFRILKNLIVISLSFMFLSSGDEGLLMLQTTMNKGVGTATLATYFATNGLTSLLFSSFIVKKLGSKNSQILGIILILPFIASNAYPMWIIMLLSAVLRGIGKCLLWAAQCTYFNESSVLYSKISINGRKSTLASKIALKCEETAVEKETITFKSNELKIEQLSAFDLLNETNKTHSPLSKRNSVMYPENVLPVRLIAYKYKVGGQFKNKLCSNQNTKTTREAEAHDMKVFSDSKTFSREKKEDLFLDTSQISIEKREEAEKYRSYVDSTKSFFFGIHGLAYNSATIWSSLISYNILETGDKVNYNKTSNYSCGAGFCSTNKNVLNNSIKEVPDDTRHLLIGVCMASGIIAPLLMLLFLDRMVKTSENVKLSWKHVFATIKYIKKKDQLLLIPFTIGACLCRGFYIADFTKSYIACAWSISRIGLITIIYGATSALSSISSGVLNKYVGRRTVLVLCQLLTIANFIFLFFWYPNAQQPYMFYVQGGFFGMISGIFNSQTRALYGIFFEGDEATAFSSCNLYSSIGWTLPFIYNEFLCVSAKIYIVLAFTCTGMLGYLLAERSYSLRKNQTG